MAEQKKAQEPPLGEILASDQAYNFLNFAYNLSASSLNYTNPSVVWEEMLWNPWLSQVVCADIEAKDDVISSQLDTRKDAVLSKSRRVLPAGEKRQDKRAAELIEETLESYFDASAGQYNGFDHVLREMLDATGFGVSIGEKIFDQSSDRIYIKNVKFKPQVLFSFSDGPLAQYSTPSYFGLQTGPLRLRNPVGGDGIGMDGLLPEGKFVVATFQPRLGDRWGRGLVKKLFWSAWFKRQGMKQFLRYAEKGSGSVLSRYPQGGSAAEKLTALLAALAVNEESAAAVPEGYPIEVLQHVRQSMGDAFYQLIDDICNNNIMRVISGQTLTGRGGEGGGWSRGDVHQKVRSEKVETDAKFLMWYVNTAFVFPLVLFNHGPVAKPPLWTIAYEPEMDLSALSTWLYRLWQMKVPIKKDFVYTSFSLPTPSDGDEVLEPPSESVKTTIPESGADSTADYSEKKTPESSRRLNRPSTSKTARFNRLRPTTMRSSSE